MKHIGALLMAIGLLQAGTDAAAESATKASSPTKEYKKANSTPIAAYIVLLRLRYDLYGKWKSTGKWPEEDKAANAALQAHSEYWQERLTAGQALLGAGMKGDYWDNAAFIVFEAESLDKARDIVAADPAVKAFVFQAEVRALDVSFISNKYGTTAP